MVELQDIPMFSSLDKKFHKELKENIYIKKFAKNSIVFYEGDESDYLYIIFEGTVRLYKTTPKGSQVHINCLNAPDTIAEYGCFEKKPFPATCEFITDGVMGLLHFEKVYNYLNNREFSLGLIKSLTSKVMLLSALVHRETVLRSEAKVADLMIKEIDIFNRLKNNQIAGNLNLSPETFSRIITKFKRESIVKVESGELKILNLDALLMIVETNSVKNCTNCIAEFKQKLKKDGKL
ncbi:transcriptional regulator, Crp/Fnr family [hydrothermal vent metagenome]|uniref:Transcriptional regulator, Crp/Fnr family n=1 Tax=hydrothermal vent metagenome TaxID=652676 RepID=A0A1W1BRQ2_9ZZZZ